MIEVIIAVAGLALVEAPSKGPISILLPETEGFDNPAPLLNPDHKARGFRLDDHDILVDLADAAGSGMATIDEAQPFTISIDVAKAGNNDLTSAASFPRFAQFREEFAWPLRKECRFGSKSCEARTADGLLKPLLAGQIQLSGTWKLVAAESGLMNRHPGSVKADRTHLARVLVDDAKISRIHSTAGGVKFADTFAFVGEVADGSMPKVTGSINGMAVAPYRATGSSCQVAGVDSCLLLWIENSPNCGTESGQLPCVNAGDFLCKADTHFAQLYRLLDLYDPNSGSIAGEVIVPFDPSSSCIHHKGDSSPRCYGGILQP